MSVTPKHLNLEYLKKNNACSQHWWNWPYFEQLYCPLEVISRTSYIKAEKVEMRSMFYAQWLTHFCRSQKGSSKVYTRIIAHLNRWDIYANNYVLDIQATDTAKSTAINLLTDNREKQGFYYIHMLNRITEKTTILIVNWSWVIQILHAYLLMHRNLFDKIQNICWSINMPHVLSVEILLGILLQLILSACILQFFPPCYEIWYWWNL